MNEIAIRGLDERKMFRLRALAAIHDRTVEEEAAELLRQAIGGDKSAKEIAESIRSRFTALGGFELELPPRDHPREPPNFD